MISVLCPYCNASKVIVFEPVFRDLILVGHGTTICNECKKEFKVYNGPEMIEVEKL